MSTSGCQDIVRFFQLHPASSYDAVILQAAISDREYWEHIKSPEDLKRTISAAVRQINEGKGHYPLPMDILELIHGLNSGPPPPITANRWHSLAAKGGKEDYFSSDLDDQQLMHAFRGLEESGKKSCIFLSGKDEYYPDFVDKDKILARFEKARGVSEEIGSHSAVLEHANHSLEDDGVMQDFVDRVIKFLQSL